MSGAGLLLVAKDSRSQGIGSILRNHTRINAPSVAPAPTSAGKPGMNMGLSNQPRPEIVTQKRLLLSAEGSSLIFPVPSGRINYGLTTDGEIWLTVSYEDGAPFTQVKAADIHIETLNNQHYGGDARLDQAMSRPADGVWHFILPQIQSGSHFYRIHVESNIDAWKTNFEGQTIARASYTRMPYWNAQRADGTIWQPPK